MAPRPELYGSLPQVRMSPSMALVMRTRGDPMALAKAARAAIAEVDPAQPVFSVRPLESLVQASLGGRRFTLTLMLIFGVVALLLAAVGIYGVVAYGVAQRTQEIGIRMALGAQPVSVLGLVVGDGMRLVAAGLLVGVAAALALSRLLATLLYGIGAVDALTYAAIALVLVAVALVAILIPARRATRVDPTVVLRYE
jgi:putative ABC transport system permease protein